MKLSELTIKNFRSIEDETFEFNDLNILVGKNNSGKSNVLKAIDLVLREGYTMKLTTNDYYLQDETKTVYVSLEFNNFTTDELEIIRDEIKYPVTIDYTRYSQDQIYHSIVENDCIKMVLEITGNDVSKKIFLGDIPYKYFSNDLKAAIVNTVYIPAIRDHSQILRITKYSFLNRLLNKIYEMAEEEKKEELNDILANASEKCKEIFREYEEKIDQMSKLIIQHDGVRFSILPSDRTTIYKKLDILLNDGIETELDFKGSGIQSVLVLTLFKLYADLKVGGAILLIEEPESFLHPHANRHMSKILKEFSSEDNIQIIFSTHSPNYLEDVDFKDIILLRKENHKSIKKCIGEISDEIKLKKEMTSSNLELFFSDKVVLVEGQTENFILPYYAKDINLKFDFDKKNISLIDVGSKSNLSSYIELLNDLEIPWLAMVDRDFVDLNQSKRLLMKMNRELDIDLDLENDTEVSLIAKLADQGICVLKHGGMENYYSKEWLLEIIYDIIENECESDDTGQIKTEIQNYSDINNRDQLKKDINTTFNLSELDSQLIEDVINVKTKLLELDMTDEGLGKSLEKIFNKLHLTKPKIALRIRNYIRMADIEENLQNDISNVINKIFQ